jgi:hypothetical protein
LVVKPIWLFDDDVQRAARAMAAQAESPKHSATDSPGACVAECFGLSGLRGHRTGGSLHVIINNQIGFTTNPALCADLAVPVRCRQDDRGARSST